MKPILLVLAFLSTPAFAADTIVGLLHTNPADSEFTVQLPDGTELPVGLHFQGGSACGAFRHYAQEVSAAEGHVVRLTGVNVGHEFLIDLGGIEILR